MQRNETAFFEAATRHEAISKINRSARTPLKGRIKYDVANMLVCETPTPKRLCQEYRKERDPRNLVTRIAKRNESSGLAR